MIEITLNFYQLIGIIMSVLAAGFAFGLIPYLKLRMKDNFRLLTDDDYEKILEKEKS